MKRPLAAWILVFLLLLLVLAALACSLPSAAPTVVVVETVVVVVTPAAPATIAALPSDTAIPQQPQAAASATPWPTNTPGPTNTPEPTNTPTPTKSPTTSPTIQLTPSLTPTYAPENYWRYGSPTPFTACPGTLPSRLWAGGYAYVIPDPPLANRVRDGAGTSFRQIGTIEPGWGMQILEGPVCADGLVWWKVRSFNEDLTGWTAEQDGKSYWLAPCPLDTECGVMMP